MTNTTLSAATILNTTKTNALNDAKAYRGGKIRLQRALGYVVTQLLHGNADAIDMVFRAAELVSNSADGMLTNADGRAVWKYLTHKDGLNLKGVVMWDKDARRFKMAEGWSAAAAGLDLAALANTLAFVRWDKFDAQKAEMAFDLDRAVLQLVKRASSKGATQAQIRKAFDRAVAA